MDDLLESLNKTGKKASATYYRALVNHGAQSISRTKRPTDHGK